MAVTSQTAPTASTCGNKAERPAGFEMKKVLPKPSTLDTPAHTYGVRG